MRSFQVTLVITATFTLNETVIPKGLDQGFKESASDYSLAFMSIEPIILHKHSTLNQQIVSFNNARWSKYFKDFSYECQLEVTLDSSWTCVVWATSIHDAAQAALYYFRHSIILVPTNGYYLHLDNNDFHFEHRVIVEDEISVVNCSKYVIDCSCNLQEERARRKRAIAQIYKLNKPESLFLFDKECDISLLDRLGIIMTTRWEAV